MIATAAATAARAVGTHTAPAVVGAVRSFWADVPPARVPPFVVAFVCRRPPAGVLLARPVAAASRPIADVSIRERSSQDPILGISEMFPRTRTEKTNLSVGVTATTTPSPWFGLRARAESLSRASRSWSTFHERQQGFVQHNIKLAFEEDSKDGVANGDRHGRTLSGTSSCPHGGLHALRAGRQVYIPVPTWSNHHQIWKDAGCEEKLFRYYKPIRGLDFEGLMTDIESAEEGRFLLRVRAQPHRRGPDARPVEGDVGE